MEGEMKHYTTKQMMRHGIPIHIFFSNLGKGTELHTHDFIEIIYVSSGNATQTINGDTFQVSRGDLMFLNYGCLHSYTCDKQFAYYNICFAPEYPAERLIEPQNAFGILALTAFDEMRKEAESGRVRFSGEDRTRIEWIFQTMLQEYERMQPSVERVLESYMNILIIEILRKTVPAPAETTENIWENLRDYIENNLNEPLTLSALAQKCFYNPSYFSRIFKERYHVSMMTYVTERRMEHVKKRLRESNDSITVIARECGFPNMRAFYRAFNREENMTPSDYRKKTVKG